jgi:hypothetical protein
MVIPDQTITGVSGLGADAPRVLRRTAELIPDQLLLSFRRCYTRLTAPIACDVGCTGQASRREPTRPVAFAANI